MDKTAKSAIISGLIRTCSVSIVLAAMGFGTGCTSSRPADSAQQYLDAGTGITVNGLQESAIFYHADPRLAAHVRDYLYVGPVEMNRMGKYYYYMWLGEWSTIDRLPERKSASNKGSADKVLEGVVVLLDGVPMELHDSLDADEKSRIMQHPYDAPVGSMRTAYMRVSRDQLVRIAAASSIVFRVGDAEYPRTYKLWSGNTDSFGMIIKGPAAANNVRPVNKNK
jgi:hypothetical protein